MLDVDFKTWNLNVLLVRVGPTGILFYFISFFTMSAQAFDSPSVYSRSNL